MRIALGGIRHETNTFSPVRTTSADFVVLRGADMLQGSFWEEWRRPDMELLPTLSAEATPNGLIEQETYQALKDELLERLRAVLPVDGIYLDLHGAMEVAGIGDGECDLVAAIRGCVGSDVLISASLDLHGNIGPDLVEQVNILTAFRTAPHRDADATRQRAIRHLERCIRTGMRPQAVMIKVPLLLPGEFAITEIEPARTLYRMLPEIDMVPGVLDSSLLIGYAWADSPHASVSVIVVAEQDRTPALRHAARLATAVWKRRADFQPESELLGIDQAIALADSVPEHPVFLSDTGDNVTAGGAGDIPLFIERLLAAEITDAVVAGIRDPDAVSLCAAAGLGNTITAALGGKLDSAHGAPLLVSGMVAHLDPTEHPTLAVLRVGGVKIILTTDRRPFTSLASFHAAGIDPLQGTIVVVKLGYLFPELRDLAPRALLAASPGYSDLQLGTFPYRLLRRPIFPLDAAPTPESAKDSGGS
jgi:microcystin degradation protein MlrC